MLGVTCCVSSRYRFDLVHMLQPFRPTRRLSDEPLTASTPELRLKIHPSILLPYASSLRTPQTDLTHSRHTPVHGTTRATAVEFSSTTCVSHASSGMSWVGYGRPAPACSKGRQRRGQGRCYHYYTRVQDTTCTHVPKPRHEPSSNRSTRSTLCRC